MTEASGSSFELLLEQNVTLKTLALGWNCLGARGAKSLARGLHANVALTHLLIPWGGLGDLGSSYIAEVCSDPAVQRPYSATSIQSESVASTLSIWQFQVEGCRSLLPNNLAGPHPYLG